MAERMTITECPQYNIQSIKLSRSYADREATGKYLIVSIRIFT